MLASPSINPCRFRPPGFAGAGGSGPVSSAFAPMLSRSVTRFPSMRWLEYVNLLAIWVSKLNPATMFKLRFGHCYIEEQLFLTFLGGIEDLDWCCNTVTRQPLWMKSRPSFQLK
jgi:hypothetical protein